jgi:uncharacterized Zn-binding protein involved in type VI secretion
MGNPAANKNSMVQAIDTHILMVPSPGGPVPTPLPHPFVGPFQSALSTSVNIGGQPAATVDSVANNQPAHIPTPPGVSFQKPPANQGTVMLGSVTVKIDGKMAARMTDTVKTCNDPADAPLGQIITGVPNVLIG